MRKLALLSPAVNQMGAPPAPQDENDLFEGKFGQMAYQAFSSQFPDLVTSIVTFKILDSDIEKGSAVGAFILDHEGNSLYVPTVLADNQLKPFDILYAKEKDIFLPLTDEWLAELTKTNLTSLGQSAEIPKTVATDVDIRNLVVPPTTGRYSYASVQPLNLIYAESSEPLGRALTKHAMGPFPGGDGGSSGGKGQSGEPFNPEMWATFVEQYQRIQQMTPGQALDSGNVDLTTLAKMYKSHQKTWEMAQQAQPPQAAPDAAAMGAMQAQAPVSTGGQSIPGNGPLGPGTAGMQPKMGSAAQVAEEAVEQVAKRAPSPKTWGNRLDHITSSMGYGGAAGAALGGIQAGSDGNMADVPSAMLRGGIGGALVAPLAASGLEHLAIAKTPNVTAEQGRAAGNLLGGLFGGQLMQATPPGTISQLTSPSKGAVADWYEELSPTDQRDFMRSQMMRTASVHTDAGQLEGVKALVKHAAQETPYTPVLLRFLENAPNPVKLGFSQVLQENPRLLKTAADTYGSGPLVSALSLRTEKQANHVSMTGGGLYIADARTKPDGYKASFGVEAPDAFRGVLMRSYYFKDTRPELNRAVEVAQYHTFTDPREPGVYCLYKTDGAPEPALVIPNPIHLNNARDFFPADKDNVVKPRGRVPSNEDNTEPQSLSSFNDTDHSREIEFLVLFGNGTYLHTRKLLGERVPEHMLKGTALYKHAMGGVTSKPTRGLGVFLQKYGTRYRSTSPVEVLSVSTSTGGVLRGTLEIMGKEYRFVMDPRSPVGRPRCLKDQNLIILPSEWKWHALANKERKPRDFLRTADAVSRIALDHLNSVDAKQIEARPTGANQYSVNKTASLSKRDALEKIARDFYVHAADAEAMLKIADTQGVSRAYVVSPRIASAINYQVKLAMGQGAPMPPQGAPPAMQPPPAQGPGMPPAMQPPPAQPLAPEPAPPSAIDQAFQESVEGIQSQMDQLQAQLDVLVSVQQRAQQIETGEPLPVDPTTQEAPPPGAPADPAMQGAPPPPPGAPMQGAPPPPPIDPAMQSAPMQGAPMQGAPADPTMQGAPVDPAMQGGEPQQPPMPMMTTESPSAEEIAQQVSPQFLEQAGQLQETGAFDAGALASLTQSPSLKGLGSQYSANLEDSLDDLGRTLLTLYMQEPELKEQLGDDSFTKLEGQLRDTFKGLGKLLLNLTHSTSLLPSSNDA